MKCRSSSSSSSRSSSDSCHKVAWLIIILPLGKLEQPTRNWCKSTESESGCQYQITQALAGHKTWQPAAEPERAKASRAGWVASSILATRRANGTAAAAAARAEPAPTWAGNILFRPRGNLAARSGQEGMWQCGVNELVWFRGTSVVSLTQLKGGGREASGQLHVAYTFQVASGKQQQPTCCNCCKRATWFSCWLCLPACSCCCSCCSLLVLQVLALPIEMLPGFLAFRANCFVFVFKTVFSCRCSNCLCNWWPQLGEEAHSAQSHLLFTLS